MKKKTKKDSKKPVAKKPATGKNKSSGAGKTTPSKKSSSGRAQQPAKRTVPKLRKNKAESNAKKKKEEEKEARKNGTPIPKKQTRATQKTQQPKPKKKYEKPLILRPVTIKDHKDKKGRHPHAIMDEIDNKNVSVGLTTDNKKGSNATNRKCEVDPLGTGQTSYMRRQATVARKQEYDNESERTGKMSINDYNQAEVYAERAKQKYLNKKVQKKIVDSQTLIEHQL